MDRKRTLVTGGSGFIGSHLCQRLLDMGHDVLAADNFYSSDRHNVHELLQNPRFELMRHDVTFPLYVEVDEIYHLACPASPVYYQRDPVQTTKTCVHGSINMLGLAKRLGARILLTSTSEVYGDPAVHPLIIPVFFWEVGGVVPAASPAAMIASNCERLEVFIDGTHVASALPAFDSPLYSGLIHPPFLVRLPKHIPNATPQLLVEGFAGGRVVAQLQMSANPAGDALGMVVDDATIEADGSDATRAVFRAIDAHGNQRRYGSGEVTLTLSGPATLVGDNPFAFGRYGGLGAVWIRSLTGQPGAITLTASHPLLGQAEVQVRSEQASQANEL